MQLVYFEKILKEYYETVEYGEYDREELRHTWETYLRIEDFEDAEEAFRRAAELIWLVDYDRDIVFLGVFRDGKMVYSPDIVQLYAEEINEQEVTA